MGVFSLLQGLMAFVCVLFLYTLSTIRRVGGMHPEPEFGELHMLFWIMRDEVSNDQFEGAHETYRTFYACAFHNNP